MKKRREAENRRRALYVKNPRPRTVWHDLEDALQRLPEQLSNAGGGELPLISNFSRRIQARSPH